MNDKPMPPAQCLPLDTSWPDEDIFVQSLLSFATESELFRNLCGGVHILDFLTREPELYASLLSQEWRDWFDQVDVHDVLQLLLREDLDPLLASQKPMSWRNGPVPPESLTKYTATIRKHCLLRDYNSHPLGSDSLVMPRRLVAGMKPKKLHEVQHFSAYIDKLSLFVAEETGQSVPWLADFGSGQNYLGRTLASPPYNQDVVAIERKHHNVAGARRKDVYASLAKKEKIMRNKKEYKRQLTEGGTIDEHFSVAKDTKHVNCDTGNHAVDEKSDVGLKGSITYIEHEIENGQIEEVIYPTIYTPTMSSASSTSQDNFSSSAPSDSAQHAMSLPNLMVISLHSCGNLSHHGLRTLNPTLNPSVSAVAVIGCCYNLLTERLGPVTYKHPLLRPYHPRLESTGSAYDPHGFPMSKKLEDFSNPDGSKGVRLNITARMMAVQAPYNWGRDDSEAFFTRHYYRALLQKMLMDVGIVKQSSRSNSQNVVEGSLSGHDEAGTPLIIGSLRKSAFTSFRAYVHAALEKLSHDPQTDRLIQSKAISFSDDVIRSYETRFASSRKQLAVIWSLMAFSAGVVESIIVVDRWLWLKEQVGWIGKCWVEPVFEYKHSPRNLVVVGIRKRREKQKTEKEELNAGSSETKEEQIGLD